MEMCLPDYKGGSIVNLMSSIGEACGWKSSYPSLKSLSPRKLKNFKNIVLVVIDGLGYDYLISKKDSFLYKNLKTSITSVAFPTTACAITTFLTGVAPQQHAITGWHINLKELGAVTTILPFVPRAKGKFDEKKIKIKDILKEKGVFSKINRRSYVLCNNEINKGSFNVDITKNAEIVNTGNLNNFFQKLKITIKKPGKKYIYAYWGDFDMFCHEYGKDDKKVGAHFNKIDKNFQRLFKKLEKDTVIIITADHGSVTLPLNKRIWLENHPKLKECLSAPLCAEPRARCCYVHPSKAKQFEDYIKTYLSEYCIAYKSEDLIKKGLFGLGKPNPELFDRLGDYVLIMKGNYIIKDLIIGEKDNRHLGNHGGISKEEMLVPLIILKN